MGFPSVRSSAVTSDVAGGNTNHPCTLPATIEAGDTLLLFFRQAAGPGASTISGWTILKEESPDASSDRVLIAWKKAVGDEDGTDINVVNADTAKWTGIALAIQDAADPSVTAPEINDAVIGTTGEADPDSITHSAGAGFDYLMVTVGSHSGEQTGVDAAPTGYDHITPLFANTGVVGSSATNCTQAVACKQATSPTDDAGVWDMAGTMVAWGAYTVAVLGTAQAPQPPAGGVAENDLNTRLRISLADYFGASLDTDLNDVFQRRLRELHPDERSDMANALNQMIDDATS